MDREFLIDLFADFGPVTIRRMFSGYGISADGTNFALALRAGLYFRADDQTIPQFEAEGSKPFQYQTRAKTVTVNSYWQLPARLFDDSEELAQWARAALAAAQRAALRKRPKARKAAKWREERWQKGGGQEKISSQAGKRSVPRSEETTDTAKRLPPCNLSCVTPPGWGSRRRIPDRLRRSRGCGRYAWRHRGRRRRARSANRCRRPASAWKRRPRW